MLPVSLTRAFGRQMLTLKKDSPHIFFVAGIAGVGVATVLACRATLKLSDTLDEIQEEIQVAKTHKMEDDGLQKQNMAYIYSKGAMKLTKLYAPSVIIGAASLTALTGSHVQLSRRNASLMAAYAVMQEAYDNYRERVREELGEEKELDIHRGLKEEKDPDSKELVKVGDPNKRSPYARIFDEYSTQWKKDPELNKLLVQCQQNYANQLLQTRGHLFLNEVYDMLGLERSSAGAVVGWVIGKEGDNYVDFGMYDAHNTGFVNGWERSVVLDFNVDGVIYDKIG